MIVTLGIGINDPFVDPGNVIKSVVDASEFNVSFDVEEIEGNLSPSNFRCKVCWLELVFFNF